jgi:uncharacterized protein (TIGR02284 family)
MSQLIEDTLKALHTSAIDARNGYDEALKDADGPQDLAGLFSKMRGLHDQHAAELALHLERLGESADDDGSFMSTVHRVIMDIRAWFGGLDETVLSGLIDGEMRNIAKYDSALSDNAVPSDIMRMLSDQRTRLSSALDAMQVLKRAAA